MKCSRINCDIEVTSRIKNHNYCHRHTCQAENCYNFVPISYSDAMRDSCQDPGSLYCLLHRCSYIEKSICGKKRKQCDGLAIIRKKGDGDPRVCRFHSYKKCIIC